MNAVTDVRLRWTLLASSSFSVMANATIAASMPRMAEVFGDTPNAPFLDKLIHNFKSNQS